MPEPFIMGTLGYLSLKDPAQETNYFRSLSLLKAQPDLDASTSSATAI